MYASKRTIGKQGVWGSAPADKHADRKIKHANNPNGRGRKFYCQTVKDEHGNVVRTIWHVTGHDIFALKKRKRRLRKSMKNQPK